MFFGSHIIPDPPHHQVLTLERLGLIATPRGFRSSGDDESPETLSVQVMSIRAYLHDTTHKT